MESTSEIDAANGPELLAATRFYIIRFQQPIRCTIAAQGSRATRTHRVARAFDEPNEKDKELTGPKELIRDVWSESEVLDIPSEHIKRHHSFTLLGGTSVQALRVLGVLCERRVFLDLRNLFQ
ncbi:hypothetical protein K432DRAFT_411850 [Lepidopterella palustris CBS 459.81]|uniref:Carrier domain-containing protein n=1 Tax=Lepidopterella palustris CBS 459.81 TaxID=1314670 RepID=A0A8E2DVR2_9PEZI|nr:hypothetical protein K432DRAFT_411850 [Lepidopterella palustris CBS 459.81]